MFYWEYQLKQKVKLQQLVLQPENHIFAHNAKHFKQFQAIHVQSLKSAVET